MSLFEQCTRKSTDSDQIAAERLMSQLEPLIRFGTGKDPEA